MITKEQYYELILKSRELVDDPEKLRCTCPVIHCEWHGKCKECVALHRIHNNHLPWCLQPLVQDKINALVGVVEMTATKKERVPAEFAQYIKERDKNTKGE